MKVCLGRLRQRATERKPGYLEECLRVGRVEKGFVILPDAEAARIRREYAIAGG